MAFRVSNTLVDNYQYISKHDEAVDKDSADFEEQWSKYLDGMAEAPLRGGGEPTVWHFRHLSPRQKARVAGLVQKNYLEGLFLAMAMSLVKVENMADEKGRPLQLSFVFEEGMKVVAEETLEKIQAAGGQDLLVDLALRVGRATFPESAGPKS